MDELYTVVAFIAPHGNTKYKEKEMEKTTEICMVFGVCPSKQPFFVVFDGYLSDFVNLICRNWVKQNTDITSSVSLQLQHARNIF